MSDLISRQAVLDKKELVELEDGQSFYCISPEDVETLPSVNPQYTEVEGQKNEDAISRQAAIEIARSNIHYGLDKEYEYARELLQKTMAEINSLPPVNLQPRWIPVSEILPEENKTVIASTDYCIYPEARYTEKCGWEGAYESGADYWVKIKDVTAWMPLPKPYVPETNIGKMSEIPTGSEGSDKA